MSRLRELIQRLTNSKHSVALVMSQLIAQGLNFVTLAVITIYFSPSDFGLLTLILIIPSLVLSVSTFRYDQIIQVVKSDQEAVEVVFGTLGILTLVTLLTAIVLLIFPTEVSLALGGVEVKPYLMICVPFVFFSGFFAILQAWLLRMGRLYEISKANVTQAIVGNLIIAVAPFGKYKIELLILGTFVRQNFSAIQATYYLRHHLLSGFRSFQFKPMSGTLQRYFGLARSLTIGYTLSGMNFQILVFTISHIWGLAVLGNFQMSYRLALIPCSLVSSTLGDLFKQKAAMVADSPEKVANLIKSSVKLLAFTALVPYTLLFLFTPQLAHFIPNKDWAELAPFFRIMLVQSFFTLAYGTIDKWSQLFHLKNYIFVMHSGRTVLLLLISGLYFMFRMDAFSYVLLTSVVFVGLYIYDYYYSLNYINRRSIGTLSPIE